MTQFPRAPRVIVLTSLLVGLACAACGSHEEKAGPVNPPPPRETSEDASIVPRYWELAPVATDLLDRIQEELGRRAGARILRVHEGGAAARAGVIDGDILLTVDGVVVASPAAVDAALDGRSGEVALTVLRIADDGAWSVPQLTLSIPRTPPASSPTPVPASPPPSPVASAPPASPASSRSDVIDAYFDMLDFARTEGWGHRSVTPDAVRRHAEGLLRQQLAELDAQTRAVIEQIPEAWAALQARWAAASESERREQRAFWKTRMLMPNPLLPPRGPLTTFRSEAGGHAFEHPADWVVAQGRIEDTGVLYLGPAGTRATWEQVTDPATSPPGVLFAISPLDAGLRAVSSLEEGARYVARKFVTSRAPAMREIAAFQFGTGALVAYTGRWRQGQEESFCWVVAMPFGNDRFIAARFSGPVTQAEALLPALSVILATMEVTPPDDAASLQVELAASIIGNAVVSTGWSH